MDVEVRTSGNNSNRSSHVARATYGPLVAETSFSTTIATDAAARFNIILAIRTVNLVLLGISNALIVSVTIQLYRDAARTQNPQKDCMQSASAVAAHAQSVNMQTFTALLSALVLLATIAALLSATYRSPQPEHLSLCYSIACTPFCLFVYGLQKSKDSCRFFDNTAPHDATPFGGSDSCATAIQTTYCMDIKMPIASILSLLSAGMFISEVVVVLMPMWTERLSAAPRRSYVTESVLV